MVILTCGLADTILVELKNMSATRFSYFGFEMECPNNYPRKGNISPVMEVV